LEAEIARLRQGQSDDLKEGMRSLNLTVEKARALAGDDGPLAAAASTWSSFCCVATASSASSYCVPQVIDETDPELAQAFVILHRRAVAVMGEDGAAQALVDQGRSHEVVRIDLNPPT
jgi:hypothetical protein